MITFQVENWNDVMQEAKPLWYLHYEEVAQNKDKMKLNPDIERLNLLNDNGMLHIVTARKQGELVGYHASVVETLMHYKDVLAANGDLYWLRKDCRGVTAIRLFEEVEKTLKLRGIKIIYDITKIYADHGRLFEYLGYKPIERRYSKWIGD